MRTPSIRPLGALSIAAILVACSGPSGPTTSQVTATPAAAVTPAPSPTATPPVATPTGAPASPTPTARPNQELGRVGVLAPGTYRYSQRDPAVTFTLPAGWVMTEAMPLHFGLRPTAFIADNSVRIWYDMRVASRDPSCPEAPDPEIGHSADEFAYAIRHLPGVLPTRALPITLGGLDGHQFDVQVKEEWTETCPFTGDLPARTLFTDDLDPDDPAFWGLAGYDERMRLIVLDDGADSNILITIDAVDEPTFDRLLAAALPVIESFEFGSAASE